MIANYCDQQTGTSRAEPNGNPLLYLYPYLRYMTANKSFTVVCSEALTASA